MVTEGGERATERWVSGGCGKESERGGLREVVGMRRLSGECLHNMMKVKRRRGGERGKISNMH